MNALRTTVPVTPLGERLRRPRARTAGASIALAVAMALTGCSSTASGPGGGGEQHATVLRLPGLKVGVPSPFTYGGGVGYIQASYVYDTLMWKDLDGKEIPWLASGHTSSADGLTHTYTLRDGVTWSDGAPFTADDVEFTFTYLDKHRDKRAPTVISGVPAGLIGSVKAVDPRTVEFVLTRPDWTFTQFNGAGGTFILPRHIWSDIPDPSKVTKVDTLVGTGPYTLTNMDVSAGSYRYEARSNYFGGDPAVKTIEHLPVSDPLTALKAGQLDQAGGVGPGTGLRAQAVAPFSKDSTFDVVTDRDGQTVTALHFNMASGGALADPVFRRAVARAIDRMALVDKALGGSGIPGNPGLIPPGHPLHVDVDQYGFDRDAAARELDAAGYRRPAPDRPRTDPAGTPLTFGLLISQAQPKDIVELVVADLAAIGIEANVEVVDLPTFGQRRKSGQTQLSVNTFGGTGTDEQPDGMAKVYASTSKALQSAQGYTNPEFDGLVARQRAELDPAARTSIAARMQQSVARDIPILPLVYPPLVTINRSGAVPNWRYTEGGVGGLVPSVNNKVAFIGGTPK